MNSIESIISMIESQVRDDMLSEELRREREAAAMINYLKIVGDSVEIKFEPTNAKFEKIINDNLWDLF